MEYELFQSKLKPLVDDAVFSEIVENSSLGEQPYRAEAMELVLDGSIRGRRERMVATKKGPQSDSITRPKGGNKIQGTPIQKVRPPRPAPPPQESPELPSDPVVAPTPKIVGASPESSNISKPLGGGSGDNPWGGSKNGPAPVAQKTSTGPAWGSKPAKPMGSGFGSGAPAWGNTTSPTFDLGAGKNLTKSKTQHEEPPAISKPRPSLEPTVELVCGWCGLECHPPGSVPFQSGCLRPLRTATKCAGCGTTRTGLFNPCPGCHGKF